MSVTKQTKNRSKSGRKTAPSKPIQNKQMELKEEEMKKTNHQGTFEVLEWLGLFAFVLCCVGLILGDVMGVIGLGIQKFFLGLFGISAYPVLFVGLFVYLLKMIKPSTKVLGRLLAFFGFLAIFAAFFHMLNGKDMYTVVDAYSNATSFTGGIVGFLIGSGLVALLNTVGAYIVIVGLGLLMIGLVIGVSVKKIMQNRVQKDEEWLREKKNEVREKRVQSYEKPQTEKPKKEEDKYRVIPDDHHGTRKPLKDGVLDIPFTDNDGRRVVVHTDEDDRIEKQSQLTMDERPLRTTPKTEEKKPEPHKPQVKTESKGAYVHSKGKYKFPSLNLLTIPEKPFNRSSKQDLVKMGQKLEQALASFGVVATVTQINRGPSVTRFELMPKTGVKVKQITNLADDIALALAAKSIRIEAPIPGKSAIGIEIPNAEQSTVYLREILESNAFKTAQSRITVALGKSIDGGIEITDLAKMPHLLIAGATGSGKSVCINSFIISILYKATPEEVQMVMIDPKVVELSVYNGIPHLCTEDRQVVSSPKEAAIVLNRMVLEMIDRYDRFKEQNVRDFKGYNEKAAQSDGELKPMPQVLIIIDELADLMLAAQKSVEDSINRLAAMARAAGMHLIIATQRPSVDVITGTIKANIPSRLAFAVSSGIDSKTILDTVGAEHLLGRGDMLFSPMSDMGFKRIQGTFVSDAEVEAVVEAVKQYDAPDNLVTMPTVSSTEAGSNGCGAQGDGDGEDEYYEEAVAYVIATQRVTASQIQRKFHIGFNRASNLVERMEEEGIVSPQNAAGKRTVLVQKSGD